MRTAFAGSVALPVLLGLAALVAPTGLTAQEGKGQARPASASPGAVITTMTMDDLDGVLRRMGYSFERVEGKDRQRRFRLEGRPVTVTLSERGNNVMLWSYVVGGGNVTVQKVNEWNKTKRFSRAYLDSDGDPNVEWDVDLDGGSTIGAVEEGIRTFGLVLQAFTGFF